MQFKKRQPFLSRHSAELALADRAYTMSGQYRQAGDNTSADRLLDFAEKIMVRLEKLALDESNDEH